MGNQSDKSDNLNKIFHIESSGDENLAKNNGVKKRIINKSAEDTQLEVAASGTTYLEKKQ